jgi:hypothetical protein
VCNYSNLSLLNKTNLIEAVISLKDKLNNKSFTKLLKDISNKETNNIILNLINKELDLCPLS